MYVRGDEYLGSRLSRDDSDVVNHLLDGVGDKIIKGVDLLRYELLLFEISANFMNKIEGFWKR